MEKKLVLPGDHLSSAEEAEAGENTYSERDEIYSAAVGENETSSGHTVVKTKGRTLRQPMVGMKVYCLITKASPNKAVGGCIPVEEVESGVRGVEIEAVLPVTSIRSGYVRDMRDEVKVGDIIKAKIQKIEKTGFEISMFDPECGVVVAFCPYCREKMLLDGRVFVCLNCGWKEKRKLPCRKDEHPSESRKPHDQHYERHEMLEEGKEPYGPRGLPCEPRTGFRKKAEERRRTFGRRPGPGGRRGSY